MIYLYYIDGDRLVVCRSRLVEGIVVEDYACLKNYVRIVDRLDSILDLNELQQALSNLYLGLS